MLSGETNGGLTKEGKDSADTITTIMGTDSTIQAVNFSTNDEAAGFLDDIFGTVWNHYYVSFTQGGANVAFRGAWIDGNDIKAYNSLEAYLINEYSLTQSTIFTRSSQMFLYLVAKGSIDSTHADAPPAPEFVGYCDSPTVHLRWDQTDSVDATYDGGTTWHQVSDSTITTQALLKAWLEAIYPDDDYTFAYHVNSGEICVEWQGKNAGSGTFTFSVDLQEQIEIGDEVTAWIVRKNRNMRNWL
jgi:hypothetical protein